MAFSPVDRALDPLFALQAGVVSRAQVLDHGGSDDLIRHRLRSGAWTKYRPGVYQRAGLGDDPLRPSWAAVLSAGPRAAVSHESAGRIHGVDGLPRRGTVITVPHPSHPRMTRVVVHQSTDLRRSHIMKVNGLPVTKPARTLMDLAAVLGADALRDAGEQLIISRKVGAAELARLFAELARPGKRGFGQLGEVLDNLISTVGVSESFLEARFLEVVHAAELEEPIPQYPFPGRHPSAHRVDFAFPAHKLIIEIDGRSFHSRLNDMVNDRERDMAAAAAGWQVVRIMWETLRDEPDRVVRLLRQILAQRAA